MFLYFSTMLFKFVWKSVCPSESERSLSTDWRWWNRLAQKRNYKFKMTCRHTFLLDYRYQKVIPLKVVSYLVRQKINHKALMLLYFAKKAHIVYWRHHQFNIAFALFLLLVPDFDPFFNRRRRLSFDFFWPRIILYSDLITTTI